MYRNLDTSLEAFNAEFGIFPFSIPIGEPQSIISEKKCSFIKFALIICVRIKIRKPKCNVKWQLKYTIAPAIEFD